MKITVVGSGYVGLVSGTCFAEMGNTVTCVDNNQHKIKQLQQGISPIYEPGLEKMLVKNIENQTLFFTSDLANALKNTNIVFIAVGTPMKKNGDADLSYVYQVAKEIGEKISNKILVVNKSTVPVGTADKVKEIIELELQKRNVTIDFDVASNPEFLKEGDAINDFMKPDRVVIGANDDGALQQIKKLYSPFFRTHDRFITVDVRSAEMTKYAANAMLATKISFMNEIANICEQVNADVNKVRLGIGSDKRIGYSFIYPGIGYGGACFPKDIKALYKIAEKHNYNAELLAAVDSVNTNQKSIISKKIITRFGENLEGLTFAIWGLSYKPGTDDMREAPSIQVIKDLVSKGAHVSVYDPKAIDKAKYKYLKEFKDCIVYAQSKYEALQNADAIVLLTEWKEFRSPDFLEIKKLLKNPIIFDGRNQYNAFDLPNNGFEYYQIGKK